MIQITFLILALLAANSPWFSERLFYIFSLKNATKSIAWCLFELVILYFMVGAVAIYAERSVMGQAYVQHWEYYAITACMFLVFAFPGFVYRYFWKSKLST